MALAFPVDGPRLRRPAAIERAGLSVIAGDALTDPLTGLFSRAFLEVALEHEMARCRRRGLVSSLVLLDLDDFKAAGRYGLGDAALQAVSEVICPKLRGADVPCRYGDDEFAILLPDTYRSDARVVAERIRADVRDHFLKRPFAGWLGLTVSVGVAAYGANCATGAALLDAAEGALHEAKAGGGDRIALSLPRPAW